MTDLSVFGCKKFHFKTQVLDVALDRGSEEPHFSRKAPHPHKQQAVSAVVHAISCPVLRLPRPRGADARALLRKSTEAMAMPLLRPHRITPRGPSDPHHTSNLPAEAPQQHLEKCRGTRNPRTGTNSAIPPRAAPTWMHLPSCARLPLLRAANVLTGRNADKQLGPSEPVVPCQESTQMPVPPFPGRHPHLQVCSAGVIFELLSGTFILFSFMMLRFALKPPMCHRPHITFWKMPSWLSTSLPSRLSLIIC